MDLLPPTADALLEEPECDISSKEKFLSYPKERFLGVDENDERRRNAHVVRADLVHISAHNPAQDIVNIIRQSYVS